MYAPQQEIRDYLERTTDKYGVRPHIRFHTRAISAEWDEAAGLWRCVGEGPDGQEEMTARFVVSGIGGLHVPAKPHLQGLESFEGPAFHSAEWDHSVDLRGQAGRGHRHRRVCDPVRPRDRQGRRAARPLPAHRAVGPAEARPPHHEGRAPSLPPLPCPPAGLPPRHLLVPGDRDDAGRDQQAVRPALRAGRTGATSSAR